MIIVRELQPGMEVKIELTPEELLTAYCEEEHKFDIRDVKFRLNELDELFFIRNNITPQQVCDRADAIAYDYRRYLDENSYHEAQLDDSIRRLGYRPEI